MAIINTGRFAPATNFNSNLNRDYTRNSGNRKIYQRDCRYHKENPADLVKWMRRNFGERHQGWDFSFVSDCVIIELWDDRLITMYEMWKN